MRRPISCEVLNAGESRGIISGDISSLGSLTRLRTLVLTDPEILGNVVFLGQLEQIESLILSGTNVKGRLSPENMLHMRFLCIEGTQVPSELSSGRVILSGV